MLIVLYIVFSIWTSTILYNYLPAIRQQLIYKHNSHHPTVFFYMCTWFNLYKVPILYLKRAHAVCSCSEIEMIPLKKKKVFVDTLCTRPRLEAFTHFWWHEDVHKILISCNVYSGEKKVAAEKMKPTRMCIRCNTHRWSRS